jgi:pyruvate formate lyase activating enzyme
MIKRIHLAEMGTRIRIGGITDMSTVDWYSNVALVVFWAGCNIRCPYCHNSLLIPPDSGAEVDLTYIDERLKYGIYPVPSLDAVVFTGGEPLLQPDALIETGKLVKQYGLKLMLDTNGTLYEAAEKVLRTGLFNRVALDVKSPLTPEAFGNLSGVPEMAEQYTKSIIDVIKLCNDLKIPIEARTTVAPSISDAEEYIRGIARAIKGKVAVYYLQQFDNQGDVLDPELKQKDPPKKESLIKLAEAALNEGLSAVYIKTRFDGLEEIK